MFTPRLDRFGDELPRDALVRYGTTRFRHGFALTTPRWSPDGRVLASTRPGGVDLWDGRSGAHARTIDLRSRHALPAVVRATILLDDGTMVTASDENAALWSVGTGILLRTFEGVAGDVAASPDGRMLVALDADNLAQRYDLRDGRALGPLTGADLDGRARLAFTPDGRFVVAGTCDGALLGLFDAQTGALARTLAAGAAGWGELVFSRDGRSMVACTAGGGARRFSTGAWVELSPLHADFAPSAFASVACARDGSWILCGGDALLRRHPDEPSPRWRVDDLPWGRPVALRPDDDVIAMGCEASIWRFEAATGARVVDEGHAGSVSGFRRRRDGALVSFGTSWPAETLRWRDDASAPEHVAAAAPRATVLDVARDGLRAALVDDGALRVASLDEGAEVTEFPQAGRVTDARFLPDGRLLVAREGGLATLDPETGGASPFGEASETLGAVSPDGARVLLRERRMVVRSLADGAALCAFKHPKGLADAAFTRDGATLVTLDHDDGLRAWDALTGAARAKVLRVLPAGAKGPRPMCFALSPDGAFALVGDGDGGLYGAELDARRVTHLGPAHRSGVRAVAFDDDGATATTAGDDATLLRWDVSALRDRCRKRTRPR